jgi:hypothetical protein
MTAFTSREWLSRQTHSVSGLSCVGGAATDALKIRSEIQFVSGNRPTDLSGFITHA